MYRVSQLIASASGSFRLKNNSHTITVSFLKTCDIGTILSQLNSAGLPADSRLSLHFDNITGNDLLPAIDIYLNAEEETLPAEENYVGSMGLYGLGESSSESNDQDSAGQSRVFDVSEVFRTIFARSNWSEKQFTVTLLPDGSLSPDAYLSIGRVYLYFYKL